MMKKMFIAALLMVGMASFAQEKPKAEGKPEMEQYTPEQRNQLQLKKLTLDLGLNASQQKEMEKIIAEQSAKRQAEMADRKARKESNTKLTQEERFAKQNQKLDDQIALKEKVKKILTPEQFEKWEKSKEERRGAVKEMLDDKKGKPAKQ